MSKVLLFLVSLTPLIWWALSPAPPIAGNCGHSIEYWRMCQERLSNAGRAHRDLEQTQSR